MTVVLRDYGHTQRCHVVRTVHKQSVAEHSHGVALFCAQLYGGKPSANLLLAALYHDLPECVTGDVPATAKWRSKELDLALTELELEFQHDNDIEVRLTKEENFALKLADLLDLGFYCIDEMQFGNMHVESMYRNVDGALLRMTCDGKLHEDLAFNFWQLYNEMNKRANHAIR